MNTNDFLTDYNCIAMKVGFDVDSTSTDIANNWDSMSTANYKLFVRSKASSVMKKMQRIQSELEQILALKKAENQTKRLQCQLVETVSQNLRLHSTNSYAGDIMRSANINSSQVIENSKIKSNTNDDSRSGGVELKSLESITDKINEHENKDNAASLKEPRLSDFGISNLSKSIVVGAKLDQKGKIVLPVVAAESSNAPRLSDFDLSDMSKTAAIDCTFVLTRAATEAKGEDKKNQEDNKQLHFAELDHSGQVVGSMANQNILKSIQLPKMPEINEDDFKSNELREMFKADAKQRQSMFVPRGKIEEIEEKITPCLVNVDLNAGKSTSVPIQAENENSSPGKRMKKHSNAPSSGSLNGSFVASPHFNFDYLYQNPISGQLRFDNDDSVTLVPVDQKIKQQKNRLR